MIKIAQIFIIREEARGWQKNVKKRWKKKWKSSEKNRFLYLEENDEWDNVERLI